MTPRDAAVGSRRPSRTVLLLIAALGLLIAAHLLDPAAVIHLRYPAANDRDWGRLLRILGFAPTWLLVAAAFWMHGRGGSDDESIAARDTALAILAAIAIGGLGAEALKLIFRRERPLPTFQGYSFRPFADRPFSTGRLGLPSSHTMVAFAGAATLASRYPRTGWIVLGMAAGCGLTRIFAGAHFLSDVVAGAIGGIIAGVAATRWVAARRQKVRLA